MSFFMVIQYSAEIWKSLLGSVHNLRPGGENFRGPPFSPRIRGDQDFFVLWSGGLGKILTASKGGGPVFFRATHDKKENYSRSILGRPFILSGIVDLTKAQKIVGPNFFILGPVSILGPKNNPQV